MRTSWLMIDESREPELSVVLVSTRATTTRPRCPFMLRSWRIAPTSQICTSLWLVPTPM